MIGSLQQRGRIYGSIKYLEHRLITYYERKLANKISDRIL